MNAEQVLSVVGVIATAGGGVSVVVSGVRSGVGLMGLLPWGRRRRLARRLRQLRVGQTLEAFQRRLGPHESMIRDAAGKRFIFEQPEAAVVALTDDDEVVVAYSVAARKKSFRPLIRLNHRKCVPHLAVRLGRTTFAAFETPDAVTGYLGARNYSYRERVYIGAPGNYHHYFVCHDNGSPIPVPSSLVKVLDQAIEDVADQYGSIDEALNDELFRRARAETVITRYGVTAQYDPEGWDYL